MGKNEKALKEMDDEFRRREQHDFERAMVAVREVVGRGVDEKIFSSETFQKAFAAMTVRRRPVAKITLSRQTPAEVAVGNVRCATCNDDCIIESPYDTGPGLAPCFETCPAIHEPWHVKR